MTEVCCNIINCEFNDSGLCTKESISINKMTASSIKMNCPDDIEKLVNEFEVYDAIRKIKDTCLHTSMCKTCPMYNETYGKCGIKSGTPAGWQIHEPRAIWRVFE